MPHTCPRCELRFTNQAELRQHLSLDHAVATEVLERYRYRAAHEAEPLYEDRIARDAGLRRVLIVANQTVTGPELLEQVRTRLERRPPPEFLVIVPATHSTQLRQAAVSYASAGGSGEVPTDEPGVAHAHWQLRKALEGLAEHGVQARGEIGPPDPFDAVATVLSREDVDEVILSTLPPGLSRWLGMNLPQRIERRWNVPVTIVTAAG